ncbi:MAG: nucleotidyltransferase family protein [Clostridia bacterium]|nr:nucleotidyltransferase family protein [Clostridia bacterium]
MKAIILAAGYATRLYPLTIDTPKALLPVAGKAILDHLMEKILDNSGIDEIYVVSNDRFFTPLNEWATDAINRYNGVRISVMNDGTTSNDNRRGAIGDILFAIEQAGIDDDILVAASDNLLSGSLSGYFEDFRRHGRDLLLCGRLPDIEERKRYAVLELDEENRVLSLTEKPENPKTDIVAYAEYIYRRDTIPEIRRYIAEGNNPDSPGHLPEWLYRKKEVRAYIYPGQCVDIGTVKMYRETCEAWERK